MWTSKKHFLFFRAVDMSPYLKIFPVGKVCKPRTRQKSRSPQKMSKKVKQQVLLCNFSNFVSVFFPRKKNPENVFCFLEKFTLHSVTHFQRAEKKTPFSFTHSIFAQNGSKMNFSRDMKNYDTFGLGPQKIKKVYFLGWREGLTYRSSILYI